MRFVLLAAILALTACAPTYVVLPDANAEATTQAARGAPIIFAESYTLHSAVLGDAREINVWVPPDYDENAERRYNVVYVIDGGLDQDFVHIAGLGALGALSWTYEPLIIVGVRTNDRRHELTPPATDPRYVQEFPNAGGAGDFRRYLQTELIPFIEARYRTGARRAVAGESLAGLFIVDTLLAQPGLFSDYIAISPSLWWDDRAMARRAGDLARAQNYAEKRLFLAVANEGGTMQDGIDRVRAALAQTELEMRYSDRSATETHATIYHNATLDALRWLYPMPPYDGETPWFMIEGAAPPAPQ
ncbi:MAG TPA: alpha/beta hydrolase-fold protein [Terricaulis sp.]|nr:alpha/beta hydrolase-fold protein [Terricaulis sp.]